MSRATTMLLIAGAVAGLRGTALAQGDAGRAYSNELLAASDSWTSMLAAPAAAGPNIHGIIQFRYLWNSRDEPTPDAQGATDDDSTIGFQSRRTKIWVEGEIADGWGYQIRGTFDRGGSGTAVIDNAFVTYSASDAWKLMWGQFKLPFLREQLISDGKQLTAERSLAGEVFSQDFSQGFQATYSGGAFRVMGAVSDGFNTDNTEFTSTAEADFAATGRFEYLGAGEWDRGNDFTSFKGSAFHWLLGGALHWQAGGETFNTADSDMITATVDASFEGDGWNVFVAGIWRNLDTAGSGDNLDDFGFTGQGGIFVGAKWELFGRVSAVCPDNNAGGAATFWELTAGVNYYVIPDSHAAKLTVDLCVFPSSTSSNRLVSGGNSGIGLLTDTGDPQWAIRGQFQLLF